MFYRVNDDKYFDSEEIDSALSVYAVTILKYFYAQSVIPAILISITAPQMSSTYSYVYSSESLFRYQHINHRFQLIKVIEEMRSTCEHVVG